MTLVSDNQGDENAYADLSLMTLCQHFIIANSTFNGGGHGCQSTSGNRRLRSGFEMRKGKMWWGFKGLLPEEWLKL